MLTDICIIVDRLRFSLECAGISVSVRCLCLEIQTKKAPLVANKHYVIYDDHLYTLNNDSSFHSCHLRRSKSFQVVEEPEVKSLLRVS